MEGIHRLRITWVAGPILAVALLLVATTPSVYATYNGTNAAVYANNWATSRNPYYLSFSNDCQNFVSQAVSAGGFSFVGVGGSTTDDHNWFFIKTPSGRGYIYTYTISWTVQSDYHTFLRWDVPGGWDWGTYYGYQSGTSSGLATGDVLFFNWDYPSDTITDHSVIQVLTGNYTDVNSGWVGDEVDAHNNDRAQAYWALTPYNQVVSTTSILITHIDPSNP